MARNRWFVKLSVSQSAQPVDTHHTKKLVEDSIRYRVASLVERGVNSKTHDMLEVPRSGSIIYPVREFQHIFPERATRDAFLQSRISEERSVTSPPVSKPNKVEHFSYHPHRSMNSRVAALLSIAFVRPPITTTTRVVSFCYTPTRSFCSNMATTTDEESINAIKAKKQALRKEIRAKVKALDTETIAEQSALVWKRVYDLKVYQNAKSVGLFLSMPTCEIQTDAILNHANQQGKTVYVPQVGANFELADMEMIQCPSTPDFHKAWPTNKWKIPEPPADMERLVAQPGDLDLLIVPGLAFDQKGGRCGQGKGYYDRFIAKMRQGGGGSAPGEKPRLVAVGMEPQLVESIPTHEHDFTMEAVVLPQQTIFISESIE